METLTAQSQAAVVTQGPTTASIADFRAANGFDSAFQYIRVNTSGYPYITFINSAKGDQGAENIYFSVNAADKINALLAKSTATYVDKNGSVLPALHLSECGLKDMLMTLATYTDGRPSQWKISSGNSQRITADALAALGI